MAIQRFVAGGNTYTFPETIQDLRDNFKNVVPRTTRLPGADGGFPTDGAGKRASEIGNISFSFYLRAYTRSAMEDLRDAVHAMTNWGLGRLYMQPSDPADPERWAWCAVNNITTSRKEHEHTNLLQRVQCSFQAPDPYWYAPGNLTVWGGTTWGGGEWLSDNTESVSGAISSLTETNNGNATTHPIISLLATDTCVNPRVERLVDGAVVDRVKFNAVLSVDDELVIDCRGKRVLLNTADAYTSAFSFLHPDWMRLLPGSNALRVVFDGDGEADVTIGYYARYF
jgi:hypothetical protein